jgi:hypothetical protein
MAHTVAVVLAKRDWNGDNFNYRYSTAAAAAAAAASVPLKQHHCLCVCCVWEQIKCHGLGWPEGYVVWQGSVLLLLLLVLLLTLGTAGVNCT